MTTVKKRFPVCPFNLLNATTMTITVPLNIDTLNIDAILILLKKNDVLLNFKHRKLPGSASVFPTAITMSIKTSVRKISIKFSKTIKITGAPRMEIAQEAVVNLLRLLNDLQDKVKYVCDHKNELKALYDRLWVTENETDETINKYIMDMSDLYTKNQLVEKFLLKFDGSLFTGKLEPITYQNEMINIPFDLGFTINQKVLAEVIQKKENDDDIGFICYYNNVRENSALFVQKFDFKVRKGENRLGRTVFKINRSSYCLFSGVNLQIMEVYYYKFLKTIIETDQDIMSSEFYTRKIKVYTTEARGYTPEEYKKFLDTEEEFREMICRNDKRIYKFQDL